MVEQVMLDQSRDQPLLRLEENCHFHSTQSFRLRPDSTLVKNQLFPFIYLNKKGNLRRYLDASFQLITFELGLKQRWEISESYVACMKLEHK